MSNVQLYTLAYCTADGKLLTEEASLTVNRATNSQAVNTVAKGYAGESPGAPTVEIQVTNAVPAADFELNAGPFMKSLKAVEMGVIVAGKQLVAKGFIIADSFKHSVNSESNYDFTFRGGFEDFE
jgi:hypothetical protein